MYSNYRGLGRGTDQNFSSTGSGTSSSNVTLTTSIGTTQSQEVRYLFRFLQCVFIEVDIQ